MKACIAVVLGQFVMSGALAASTESITVLGLPLGGKMKISRECDRSERLASKARSTCWSGPPIPGLNGSRFGWIEVPHEEIFPQWAAQSSITINITRDGTLDEIDVHTPWSQEFSKIRDSIASRFGQPLISATSNASAIAAVWDHKDIYIKVVCSERDKCKTTFQTSALQATYKDQMEQIRRKNAARPIAP